MCVLFSTQKGQRVYVGGASLIAKNNLAIVRTKENFIYQEHIGPTCLPRPNESFESPRKSRDCWSSGWGADSYADTALYSDGLRKVKLPVVPRDECEERLANTDRFAGRGFRLHESWMCIGGIPGNDTCKGDGGSPHVCKTEKGWTQIGAVAWGIDCGKEVPAVYSSLTSEDPTTPRQASTGSLERIARHGWMRILSWEIVARSSTFQSTRGPQGKVYDQINKL